MPAAQFVARWNRVAEPVSAELGIKGVPEPGGFKVLFSEFLTMEGAVNESKEVDSFTVVIDPTGPGEEDRLGIQTLGVAALVAEPGLDGPGASDLLLNLGLDVDNPNLDGLDGTLDRNGLRYHLRYDPGAVRLYFTISPVPESS